MGGHEGYNVSYVYGSFFFSSILASREYWFAPGYNEAL